MGELRKISGNELQEILRLHAMWLCGEEGGQRAILTGADLRGFDLRGVDLRGVYLCGADISGTNLTGVDLSPAFPPRENKIRMTVNVANLRGVKWDADTKLSDANLDHVILPIGFPSPGSKSYFPFHIILQAHLDPSYQNAEGVKEYLLDLKAFIDHGSLKQASGKRYCNRQTIANHIQELGNILGHQLTKTITGQGAPQTVPTDDAILVMEWLTLHPDALS